jgi:CheY-like chemotaxis protein
MSAKRALIVDDSRSARVILGRMLETHGLVVDTVESGEQALDYLRSAHPDVVFMDHLMPGMDGFEATRAIKANERTADIPVMMYTSQDGEIYLQQARKIGAKGVLSKTLKTGDVSRALYDLHLLADRREATGKLEQLPRPIAAPAANAAVADVPPTKPPPPVPPTAVADRDWRALQVLLTEKHSELQQQSQANWDAMSARLSDKLRDQIRAMQAVAPAVGEEEKGRGWFAAALVMVALLPTAVMGWLFWQAMNDNRAQLQESTARLAMVVTEQQTQIEQLRAELRRRDELSPGPSADTSEAPIVVAYGEVALAGARVDRLRALVGRLQSEGFRGKVVVTSHIGDFCLTGNPTTGYSLAQATLSARRCDLIGNPFEDTQSSNAAPAQSQAFAQWVAAVNAAPNGNVRIEVQAQGRRPSVAYPAQSDRLTAGEWNEVASRNNRVEFAVVAQPASEKSSVKMPEQSERPSSAGPTAPVSG